MMKRQTSFAVAFFAAIVMSIAWMGCRPDESEALAQVKINYYLTWNGESIELGNAMPDVQGRQVQLERLECFVSEFALHDVEEGWIPIDTIARINFTDAQSHALLELTGRGDLQIDGLRMGLGVPAELNQGVDPALYASNHPLSVQGSSGMHWGWAAGYIFSIYEGRMLTDPNIPFAYHAGNDTCYRSAELSWDEPWLLPCGATDAEINLSLDAYKCLHGVQDTIDIAVDPETHTVNNLPLALRWVDLYTNAWSISN